MMTTKHRPLAFRTHFFFLGKSTFHCFLLSNAKGSLLTIIKFLVLSDYMRLMRCTDELLIAASRGIDCTSPILIDAKKLRLFGW